MKKRVSFMVDEDIYLALQEISKATGDDVATVLRVLIALTVKQMNKPSPHP